MLSRFRAQPRHEESALPGAPEQPIAGLSVPRQHLLSIVGAVLFFAGSAFFVARDGLFVSTDTVLIWVLAGLVALSLSDLHRVGIRLLWDWLPFGAVLLFFHYSNGLRKLVGTRTHSVLQIRFDEFFFGKPLLTVHLQTLFAQTAKVRLWEYLLFGTYLTYFFLAIVVAGLLWRFAYPRFREFRAQFVVLTAAGCATYVVYPANPPWIASQQLHLLPFIHRVVYEVWNKVGLHTAGALVERGSAFENPTAAVPSLHAAVTMLVCLFFWPIARPWARALLVVYVLAMAFTLVYSGEHYVFDIVTGWIYAAAVVAGARYLKRRRERLAATVIAPPAEPEPVIAEPAAAAGV
jgi:membrane-associated phospholipid phosphatase